MTEAIELYNKLIEANPSIERKGKTMPYTSVKGHMFSFLSKEGIMGLRLSKSDRDAFLKKFNSELMEQHGRTMKLSMIIFLNNMDLTYYHSKSHSMLLKRFWEA